MFLIVLLSLFLLGDLFWARLVFGLLSRKTTARSRLRTATLTFTTLFLLTALASLALALTTRIRGTPNLLPNPLTALVLLWHLLILPLSLLTALLTTSFTSTSRLLAKRLASNPAQPLPPPPPPAPPAPAELTEPTTPTRRQFLAASLALPPALTLATTAFSLHQLPHFRIRNVTLPIPNLPPALDGLTIAHLADTHLGDFTPPALYNQMIDATNALAADLIVHTGDVINHDSNDLQVAMAGLARLAAPLGVFACEGNHDLIQNPRKFRDAIRSLPNLVFLRNTSHTLTANHHPLRLLGLPWSQPGDPTIPATPTARSGTDRAIAHACATFDNESSDAFTIALAHHPHAFDYLPSAHLTLSGHTHGGQLMLTKNIGPGPLMYRYFSGIYGQGYRRLFVSNGAGNWFPLRLNAPAEIVKLTLLRVS